MNFIFHLDTEIQNPFTEPSIRTAVSLLQRDMGKCLQHCEHIHNKIRLEKKEYMKPETYEIKITDEHLMILSASDHLGFIYGLLSLSEKYLNIQPFWFWMDQKIPFSGSVEISPGCYHSPRIPVRYRGWFLNDEVLLMHWHNGEDRELPWRMAFEALLRCGGNMVIPGTDKSSRLNAGLADRYGLWLTHHHAEPLGAEIFARAYPDLLPSYSKNPKCFEKLWEDAVIGQMDKHVIWTLGFRGQGDCPFWESKGEETFDTPQKRGKLISELIELQRRIVCKYIDDPVFCTNLYGEVMELYNDGFITLHTDIIKVWADNGYGKMCTRRQGNHDARVPSLPQEGDTGNHGVYYHVSFHDLQAAGHMTPLPNTIDFVNRELYRAYDRSVDDYWIINSSNIRPHVYYLDAIRKLWLGQPTSDKTHSLEFARAYYGGQASIAACLETYAPSLLSFGDLEDQHAGEQFYNYCCRLLARQFILDNRESTKELYWLTGKVPLKEQARKVLELNQKGEKTLTEYYGLCRHTSSALSGDEKKLFDSTILLTATIHHLGNQGTIRFCQGFLKFYEHAYQESFYFLGSGAQSFESANSYMRQIEHGIWRGFYENDCLTDIKFTAYVIRSMMRVVRVVGDDTRFADWYEDFVRTREDRKVRLLSITENHMSDEELFHAMRTSGRLDITM